MKQLILIIVACLLASSLPAQSIKVTGQVSLGPYYSPIDSVSSVEMLAKIKIGNSQTTTLVFDSVKIYWQSADIVLPIVTLQSSGEPFQLAPGDSQDFEYGSDGYTAKLSKAQDEGKLFAFIVILYRGQDMAADPCLAELPNFKDMLSNFPKGASPRELKFVSVKLD